MLLDTNIIIEIFKGNELLFSEIKHQDSLYISAVTVMELYYGAFNKIELLKIKKALKAFELIEIDKEISFKSTELIEKYSKSHGLTIPDALIAATAITKKLPLKTLNIRDFHFIKDVEIR